jgi:hypothetical protein
MTFALPRIMLTAVLAGLLVAAGQAEADEVTVIATGGEGDLTMCPYRGCNLYHHIKLPTQIVIGDKVRLHFGSNPKRYSFPVVRILHDGAKCTVFSQATETADVEKIEVASCQVTRGAQ